MLCPYPQPSDISSESFYFDFGTQRTIFGTQSKVCYETKIEFCIKECRPANEEDPDLRHNSDLDFLSGLRTTTYRIPSF